MVNQFCGQYIVQLLGKAKVRGELVANGKYGREAMCTSCVPPLPGVGDAS